MGSCLESTVIEVHSDLDPARSEHYHSIQLPHPAFQGVLPDFYCDAEVLVAWDTLLGQMFFGGVYSQRQIFRSFQQATTTMTPTSPSPPRGLFPNSTAPAIAAAVHLFNPALAFNS